MSKYTKSPWVFGYWTIFNEDREAQKRGEPYWTLIESTNEGEVLTLGPFGRKSKDPDYILKGTGYECDGIHCSEADMRLICAAPEMIEAIKFALSDTLERQQDETARQKLFEAIADIEK